MRLTWWLQQVLGILLALACSHTLAATVTPAAEAERFDLSDQLMLLHDPAGVLTFDEVTASKNAFRAVGRQELIRGFNAGVFWLRITVAHQGKQPATRWLVVGTAKINLVTLYAQHGDDWRVMHSGRSVAMDRKPVEATDAVFPIPLAPGEQRELLIRVVARSATDMSCVLWTPAAYRFASGESRLLLVAVLSGVLVSSWLALLVFIRLHQTRYLWLSLLLIAIAGVESARENFIGFYFWPRDQAVPLQALTVFGGLAVFSLAKVISFILDLPTQMPRVEQTFHGLRWLAVGGVLVSFFDYGLGARLLAGDAVLVHMAGLILPIVLWRRGSAQAVWFAAAFSLALLLETARQLANLGILPWAKAMGFSLAGYLLSVPFILIGMVEQTRKLSEQLTVSEQLQQAKTAFLARVSHELRSPLNTILGFARMLRHGTARLPLHEGAVGIEAAAIRLLEQIDELLDESRAAAGKLGIAPMPTLFSPWLEAVAASALGSCSAQGNRFTCLRQGHIPEAVLMDGERLRQVLENLLNNANRHTHHGHIQLECTATQGDSEATLEFVLRDNGEGITEEQLKVIFEPFVRGPERGANTPSRRSGFGLGLPICRELIRQMGSDITVRSTPGEGSHFSFTLRCPLAAPGAFAPPEPAATPVVIPLPDGAGAPDAPRVLLVEDDPTHRVVLRAQLAEGGFYTDEAHNSQDAVNRLHNSLWDAVVTDQMMADGDGWQLLRQIRTSGLPLPVILLSATAPQRPPEFPSDMVFDASLRKPVRAEDLWTALWINILNHSTVPPHRWRTLSQLARDGDVSGIDDWLNSHACTTPTDAQLARWLRTRLNRLDLQLIEQFALQVDAPQTPV